MADSTISMLPSADTLLGNEPVPIDQAGATRRTTVAAIATAGGAGLSFAAMGGVADGVDTGSEFLGTDNSAALQSALDICAAERRPLIIPGGKYRFADLSISGTPEAPLGVNVDNVTLDDDYYCILADGAEFLIDDLGSGLPDSLQPASALFGSTDTFDRNAKSSLTIIGATFRGRWPHFDVSHWDGKNGRRVLVVHGFQSIVLDRIKCYDIRSQAINSSCCDSARVTNSHFERIARAAIRFNDTPDVYIGHNKFLYVGDDIINCAAHTVPNTPNELRGRLDIIGNSAFMCQSILIQGGRVTNVIGNNLKYMMAVAIRVGSCVGVTQTLPYAINILGNTVENTITGVVPWHIDIETTLPVEAAFAEAKNGTTGISVDGSRQDSSTTTAIPGFSDGIAVVDPRGLDNTGKYLVNTQDGSRAAGFGVNIANNVVVQTKLPGAVFSNFGEGLVYTHQGFHDLPITVANLAKNGISLILDTHGANIAGNVVTGHRVGAGIFLDFANTADRNLAFRDILVTGNTVIDCKRGFSTRDADSGGPPYIIGVRLMGNIWNCDPYLKSPRRAASMDGSWQAGTTVTDMVAGIDLWNISGVTIRNDIIANCVVPIFGSGDDINERADIQGCVVLCDPSTTGFSTANKGVGNVPPGDRSFTHEIWHCDATDAANFRLLKNVCASTAAAMPSSGTYVAGHFVSNTAPAIAAGKVVLGWVRLTTGSTHALNTDWAGCYVTNS